MSALRRLAARLVWMVPFAALGITACEHNPASPGSLASIVIARNPETLAIGTTVQFTATGKDANGMVVGINPEWTVAAAVGGGTINSSGVFLAGTVPGTYSNTVVATVGSIVGTATAIVTAGPVASITVTPAAPTLATNTTQQYSAVGKDGSGNVTAITPNWSVTAGGGSINSSTGMFTSGFAPGPYPNTVRASVGGVSGTASVTVDATALSTITVTPGPVSLAQSATQTFTATGKDASGNVISPLTFAWFNDSATAGGIAAGCTGATCVFTAGITARTFANTVRVASGSKTGTATVTVSFGAAASIVVTPAAVTLATSATQPYTAVVKDANGNTLATLPNWSVAAGGGTISSTGLFTAGMAPGSYTNTVRASVGTVSGSASVTVDATALATVTVTPSPVTLAIGASQTFTATGKDAGGNVISPLTIAWSNDSATAGSITSLGVFTAGTTARTYLNTVKATSGGISGTATVTVSSGVAATIVVTPASDTLAIGATQQFNAVVKDASNNTLAITPNWSVAALGGTISSTGLFTAGTVAGTYTNTATASVGSVSGSASVTVSAGALAVITVTPNPQILARRATQTFAATGKDVYGNAVPVTPTWSVVAGGGSIVSGSGLFTADTVAGLFANTVRACSTAGCASGSVAGFATVTVNAGVLATITVTPTPITMATGVAQQFLAVGRDSSRNVIPISPTWTKVGAGTINSAGLFVAGAAGGFADTVKATSGSIIGKAVVNIIGANPLAAITITPNPASAVEGATVQFAATGLDNLGGLVVISPAVTWSVVPSMSAAGTINSGSGLFTAGVAGTYSNAIQATSGSISGFASVTVTPLQIGPSLGAAATHGILAGTAVTCAGLPGTINGDASVWPGSSFSGFPPCTITGAQHAADLVGQTAQGDLTTAFLALAAMPCGTTITADLGGTTLAEGVYCSASSVGVTGTVYLTGNANSLFVIRAGSDLTTAGNVVLLGGVLPQNVFWWVGTSATIGTASAWLGNILALTSITLVDNATLTGRALARNGAVSLGTGNVITLP